MGQDPQPGLEGPQGLWSQIQHPAALELAEPLDLRPLSSLGVPQPAGDYAQQKASDSVPADGTPPQPATVSKSAAQSRQATSPAIKRLSKASKGGLRAGFFDRRPHQQPQAEKRSAATSRAQTACEAESPAQTGRPGHDGQSAAISPDTSPASTAATAITQESPAPLCSSRPSPTLHKTVFKAQQGSSKHLPAQTVLDPTDRQLVRSSQTVHAAQPATPQQKSEAFSALQPHCAAIMQLRDEPQALSRRLQALQAVVSEAERPGLQACVDYVLLPLVHLMDSIARFGKGMQPPLSCKATSVCTQLIPAD